jgi:hypothetical protein
MVDARASIDDFLSLEGFSFSQSNLPGMESKGGVLYLLTAEEKLGRV